MKHPQDGQETTECDYWLNLLFAAIMIISSSCGLDNYSVQLEKNLGPVFLMDLLQRAHFLCLDASPNFIWWSAILVLCFSFIKHHPFTAVCTVDLTSKFPTCTSILVRGSLHCL